MSLIKNNNTLIKSSLIRGIDLKDAFPSSPSFGGTNVLSMSFNGLDLSSSNLRDDTGKHVAVFNNSNISTSQFKFGTSSVKGSGLPGSYVDLGDNDNFDPSNNKFTISFWFYGSNLEDEGTQYLLTKFAGWRAWTNAGSVLYWWFTQGDGTALNMTATNQNIPSNEWNHYMATGNPEDGTIRIYFNGNFVSKVSYDGTLNNSGATLKAMALTLTHNTAFNGYIDDIYFNIGGNYTTSETTYNIPDKPMALM